MDSVSAVVPLSPARHYQQNGVAWLVATLRNPDTRAVFLCDDPGLGKTRQALDAAHQLLANRILVLAPAGARLVWAAEIAKWYPRWASRIVLVAPGAVVRTGLSTAITLPDAIVVCGYDTLSDTANPMARWLATLTWDLLVLDEAHYLKNLSNRTKAVYGPGGSDKGIQAAAKQVILLSGTPAPNHCGELYHHLRTFWPTVLVRPAIKQVPDDVPRRRLLSETEFLDRYTKSKETKWGRQIVGSLRQDELREKLKPVVLRRTKAQVLPELPPLIAQDVPLAVAPTHATDPDNATLSQETAGLTQQARHIETLLMKEANKRGGNILPLLNHLSMRPDSAEGIATLRRQLGQVKLPAVLAWVQERVACGVDKLLLFGWHRQALDRLHEWLRQYNPVLITGSTTPQGRATAVELFQTRPSVQVFIGQILAAGTAITLSAAREVAIFEPSWVPAENYQAICRAHRLGQHDSVLASFLFVPGTLDEVIMRAFRRKAVELAQLGLDVLPAEMTVTSKKTGAFAR